MNEASVNNVTDEVKEEQAEHSLSKYQESLSNSVGKVNQHVTACTTSGAAKDSTSSSISPAKVETMKPVKELTNAANKNVKNNQIKKTPRVIADGILDALAEVEDQMCRFQVYVREQKDEDKPLYQWTTFTGYPALSTAVSELDEATTKFKPVKLARDVVTTYVAQAMASSTSVSKAASFSLAAMNKKTAKYMEEMESSPLTEDAKLSTNAMITQELRKLMEHSTRAAERVWVATDLLRTLESKQGNTKDWMWFAFSTVMTATISAIVGIIAAHMVGHSGFDLVTNGGHGGHMYRQVVDLVQRTQAVTNLTGELYSIKLQDIDKRYKDLAALSESHGERIDSIVDGLGPPNEQGVYYLSSPKKSESESCKDIDSRLRKASEDASRQMQRLREEMQSMRKNMNRMDIRLSSGLEKVRKQ